MAEPVSISGRNVRVRINSHLIIHIAAQEAQPLGPELPDMWYLNKFNI